MSQAQSRLKLRREAKIGKFYMKTQFTKQTNAFRNGHTTSDISKDTKKHTSKSRVTIPLSANIYFLRV
jgi:hypothetical protein